MRSRAPPVVDTRFVPPPVSTLLAGGTAPDAASSPAPPVQSWSRYAATHLTPACETGTSPAELTEGSEHDHSRVPGPIRYGGPNGTSGGRAPYGAGGGARPSARVRTRLSKAVGLRSFIGPLPARHSHEEGIPWPPRPDKRAHPSRTGRHRPELSPTSGARSASDL